MKKRFAGKIGLGYELFRFTVPYYGELQEQVKIAVRKTFRQKKAEKIQAIEIGFGTGNTTLALLKADPRIHVLALDNEPVMHQQAGKRLKKFIRKKRVLLVNNDALAFLKKTPGQSVDIVASAITIHNFEPKTRHRLLKDVYRCLRPGGLFINSDKYAANNPLEHQASLLWQFEQYMTAFSRIKKPELVLEWIKHDLEDEKIIPKENESILELKKIGFRKVRKTFRKKIHATITAVK